MTDFDFPRLIGFCGDIGAGKDSVADYLVAKYGYEKASFAQALKSTVLDVYAPLGMYPEHVFGTQEEKMLPVGDLKTPTGEYMTGRYALEKVGTDGFRAACPETWVLRAKINIRDALNEGRRIVVTDARFSNEFDVIRRLGGKMVRVVKLGVRSQRTGHASDEAWRALRFDGNVSAESGDMQGLYANVERLLEELS